MTNKKKISSHILKLMVMKGLDICAIQVFFLLPLIYSESVINFLNTL